MTGHGGWPMTCVLDHDGNPFFAGTYFPDQPRHGQPAFRQVLDGARRRLGEPARRGRRVGGRRSARTCSSRRGWSRASSTSPCWPRPCRRWRGSSTRRAAGFGTAPKFPPSMVLEFLLRHGATVDARGAAGCSTRPARRWPAAASTTSSAAASRATPSTAAGWCRTSRRCSTTTPSCSASTPAGAGRLGERVAGRDRRLPAPRAAHRRGRLRLRARRRHRGRRGQVLRLDPGPARRGARRRRRRVGGAAARGHRARAPSSTAPRRCSCSRDPDDAARYADVRAPAARRPRDARPAGPRRQGRGRLERTGDQRARARPGTLLGEPEYVDAAVAAGELLARPAPSTRTAGCCGSPATAWPAGTPGVLEDYGCVAPGFLVAAPGHRRRRSG